MSVIDYSEKHSQAHEWNAGPCAVNVMSFCMQPDTQRAHICESMTAGVKTPKHGATRLFGFLRNEVWWWMELVRTYRMSNIHHVGLQRWVLITVVPLPRQKEALPCLCLLCRDTWWYLPSNRQRNGKSERLDLVIYQTGRWYTCFWP